jgi:hypothetical protein
VAAALAVTAVLAGCGGGGEELGAPPVNSAATVATSVPTTTAPLATTTTTAAPATTAPTSRPTTTASAAPILTPELEAELIEVYTGARQVVYEALLDPPNADLDSVARYWTPETVPGWADLLEEWVTKQWRFEPGPRDRYYATVNSIELPADDKAILRTCVVTDAAVYDIANGRYIDPGVLSSYAYTAELEWVQGSWLVSGDEQGREFKDVEGCDI